MMQLVIETIIFSRKADVLFGRDERDAIAAEIAKDPEAWPIEPGTGGLRKARIGRGHIKESEAVPASYICISTRRRRFTFCCHTARAKRIR